MTLQIDLPSEIAQEYAIEASVKGVSLERHIADRLVEYAPAASVQGDDDQNRRAHPLELPAMKGAIVGSLHRRDIYDQGK